MDVINQIIENLIKYLTIIALFLEIYEKIKKMHK